MNTKISQQAIEQYVKEKYKDVFSKNLFERYVRDYIGFTSAKFLFDTKISYLVTNNQKVLDIGSGAGSFVHYLREKGYDAYGIEINDFEFQIATGRANETKQGDAPTFIKGSALDLPYPNEAFDVVTFWDVLEHIQDYQLALKEAKRVLKPGGKIFVVSPNYCAFRKEAHYHVPWIPFFPRKLASIYLKALGKDPWFYDQCVFHLTNYKLRKTLKNLDFEISSSLKEKIKLGYRSNINWFAMAINYAYKFNLKILLFSIIDLVKKNPFVTSIDLIAIKKK